MTKPTLLVTGFNRCGSSLMMKMLDKGGAEVIAENTESYEVSWLADLTTPQAKVVLSQAPGRAIKVLDPHLNFQHLPEGDYIAIVVERDHGEQAKSIVKVMRLVGVLDGSVSEEEERRVLRKVKSGLKADQPRMLEEVRRVTRGRFIRVRFESMLSGEYQPFFTMGFVSSVCEGLDPEAMMDCIQKRGGDS